MVAMSFIVITILIRAPLTDPALRGSTEEVFTIIKPKVFEAIGVISFAVSDLSCGSQTTASLTAGKLPPSMSVIKTLICSMTACKHRRWTGQCGGRSRNWRHQDLITTIFDAYSFNMVVHISTGISLVYCLIMSIAGYLSFTDKTQVSLVRIGLD
jgi:sodium-coupled neutral amino acid transporter 11